MKQNERALLQERVRTLVLRHALEASLTCLATRCDEDRLDTLERLERSIVSAARSMGTLPTELQLAAMVAVEDAISTIRSAFDSTHSRVQAVAALAPRTAPLAA